MRIAPTLALLAALLPAGCNRNNQSEKSAPITFPAEIQTIKPEAIDPFIAIPIKPVQEVESFFQLKRDSEKGFIYIQAEKSTRGIVNHLVRGHGLSIEEALGEVIAIDRVVEEFNKKASSLKQVEINIKSLVSDKKPLAKEELEPIIDAPRSNKAPLLIPSTRDYIDSAGRLQELILSDGMTFPITVLPSAMDIMTAHGLPFPVHLSGNMSVIPNSEKMISFLDRRNNSIQQAPYLEVSEGKGPFGPGGINGLIFSGPTAVFTKDTIYFIGFDVLKIDEEKYDPQTAPRKDLLIPELFDEDKFILANRQVY